MTQRRILFWCQHLLGSGHLRRTEAVLGGFGGAGWVTCLVMGGPVSKLRSSPDEILQLPPVHVEPDGGWRLLTSDGRDPTAALWQNRTNLLLKTMNRFRPHALVVEMFPFGRRAFAPELTALLDHARDGPNRPWVACSVRDILVAKAKPGRSEEIVQRLRRWFDQVLVHGDPRWIKLDATFDQVPMIADMVRYTGYVSSQTAPQKSHKSDHILVSAGGGAVGGRLVAAATEAAKSAEGARFLWHVVAGNRATDWHAADKPDNLLVERERSDFIDLLAKAGVSVSQAGYNTVVETMIAGTPMVLVPYADAGENEQTRRAGMLAERGVAQVIQERDLSVETLLPAIDRARKRIGQVPSIDTDGVASSVRAVSDGVERRP
ncbi:MAG: glycosyltransferase family protein [Geminicoccaceae bacterium]